MSTSSTSRNKHALASRQSLHFYKDDHLATEVATQGSRHVLWANDMALAQLDQSQSAEMLRVDLANSVLGLPSGSMAYSPYGYLPMEKMLALLGFNGQWCDPITEGYPLGAGRRTYSTERMRFDSDDPTSPFGKGGPHPSAYCEGDPINRYDPTGEAFLFIALARRITSFAVKNLERFRNFNINGMTGNTAAMGTKSRKTLDFFINGLVGQQNTTKSIPLPAPSPSRSISPTTPSNVTNTATTALISKPGPHPVTRESRMPTRTGHGTRVGYRRSEGQIFAQKTLTIGLALVGAGGIITAFVVAIRHGASHKN